MASTTVRPAFHRTSEAPGSGTRLARRLVPWAIVLAYATLPMLAYFGAPLVSQDEAILLVFPEQVLAGRVPNQDFFTVYGPGNYWLLALLFKIAGPSVLAERAVGLLYHVAIVTGVVALSRSWGGAVNVTAGILSALLLLPLGLTAYAWLGGLALVVWSVVLFERSGAHLATVGSGVLAGCAVAWRYEMAAVVLVTYLILIWRDRRATPFLLGLCAGALPTLIHALVAGRTVYENVVVGRMAVNGQLDFGANMTQSLGGAFAAAGAVLLVLIHAVKRRTRLAFALAGLCVMLLPQTFQRIDLTHVLFTLCVAVPIAVAQLLGREGPWPSLDNTLRSWRVAVPVVCALVAALGSLGYLGAAAVASRPGFEVMHQSRSIPVASGSDQVALQRTLAAVNRHVDEGSVLFVGAQDMSVPTLTDVRLYHLLPEYRATAYYLDLPAGVAEAQGSMLVSDITGADALVLVDVPGDVRRRLFPYMPAGVERANNAVSDNFCRVARTAHAHVYLRCDADE